MAGMKIIFLQDVAGTGRKGDVKNVSDGYFSNFLLPRKLASLATPAAIKKFELEREKINTERKIQDDLLDKSLADLNGKTFTVKAKAGETGHLFAGIHVEEVAKLVQLPASIIELPHPIKEIGSHRIKAGKAEFEIIVEAE